MTGRPPEHYVYHSFPRRRSGHEDEIDSGLQILRSIVKSGLLLTPEKTVWQEPISSGGLSESVPLFQKRACFTDLAPSELKEHSNSFGRFSLEFEFQVLRQLGAIPVFYLPPSSADGKGLDSLAASLLCRVGEIQTLLNRLGDLEDLVKGTENKREVVDVRNNETGKQQHTRMSIGGVQDFLSFLTHGTQPASILSNALRGFSGFFCPTEDLSYTDPLGYYRQREWRIVANMSKLGEEQTRAVSEEEVETLLQIDAEFYHRELEFPSGTHRLVDQCQYFEALEGKKFIQYARRVIVPREAIDEATNILAGDDMPSVASRMTKAKDLI